MNLLVGEKYGFNYIVRGEGQVFVSAVFTLNYLNNIVYIPNNYAAIPLINQSLNLKTLSLVSCGDPIANILLAFYISQKPNKLLDVAHSQLHPSRRFFPARIINAPKSHPKSQATS